MFDVHGEKKKDRENSQVIGQLAPRLMSSPRDSNHNREQEPSNTDINDITHESKPSIGPCLLERHSQSVIMLAQRSMQQMLRRRMSSLN